jgi:hypothetical protein
MTGSGQSREIGDGGPGYITDSGVLRQPEQGNQPFAADFLDKS